MRTKYFIIGGGQNVKCVKNGRVTCSFGLNDWKPSIYTVDTLLRDSEVYKSLVTKPANGFPRPFVRLDISD